jgi:serine/threonine-protein kinase
MIATDRRVSERLNQARQTNTESAAARYEVLERASEGTLFVVYRVRERVEVSRPFRKHNGRSQQSAGAIRALKALKGAYSRHEQFAAAMLELKATTALRHPNLATLQEVGREEGTVFFVEEWLPGGSLEDHLRRVPLNSHETTQLALDLASGLEHLHENGLVHGDVRPRQILYDADGVPKLNDIGFSKAFDSAQMSLPDVQLDATLYFAPERFEKAPASVTSDLYSLGVVLYRAITGRVPFDGPSPLSIAMRHRNDAPLRPSQFNPECTPELEATILRLLEKGPEARFASATDLLEALIPERERSSASTAAEVKAQTPEPQTPPTSPAKQLPMGHDNDVQRQLRKPSVPKGVVGEAMPLTAAEQERQDRLHTRQFRRREMRGALLALFWLAVFCGLLWGVCYGAYVFWMKEAPPEVTVPKYIGLSQRNAEILLANRGLTMRIGREIYNPKKVEGTVLGGDKRPGETVRKGRSILVTVSRGEEPIRMVDFSDLTLDQARAIITRHGLRLGQIAEQYHERIPKGYVCGQYPEAGDTFRRSDPINLVISRGPQPVPTAPDPDQLPEPEDEPAAPSVSADDPSVKTPEPAATDNNADEVLVPRAALVRVKIPANGGPQEIKIEVRDATGDFIAYQQTHEAGDVVDKTVQVVRPQDGTALVRIYVGGKIMRELRI